jgi:hypothetical protein
VSIKWIFEETSLSISKMQDQIQIDIDRLREENERLRQQIQDNEYRVRCLEKLLPNEPMPPLPPRLLEDTSAWGEGKPPVPGAVPARTMRDADGNIRILLCRTYGGEGWVYTPVADGWITITRNEE